MRGLLPMSKLKKRNGFTLAEMLIVVAIILILSAVAFINVQRYQRSLGQLERDGIAKEIFVAAQNHLTAVYGEGYLGITDFGTEESAGSGIYYYVVNGSLPENSVLGQMLPVGAIDDTVRAGGSFIIRYQKDTGLVLDVFYCSKNGSQQSIFNHLLSPGEYTTVKGLAGDDADKKEARRTYRSGGNSILGWYGGNQAVTLPTIKLKPPKIKLVNEEKLYVEIEDTNYGTTGALIRLIVKGVDSGAEVVYLLDTTYSDRVKVINGVQSRSYTVILDDVTTFGMHFGNISSGNSKTFKPGEDIEVQAVAYSNSALANLAYSSKNSANSLFGNVDSSSNTAYISNMRHLENLDNDVSNLKITVATAEQTKNLSWTEFRENIRTIESTKEGYGVGNPDTVCVCENNLSGRVTADGCYMPISPNYALEYKGMNHSISEVNVSAVQYGGLFESTESGTTISDLELLDFSITASNSAGALAATTTGTTVTNVIARNTDYTKANAHKITAPTAGGLIGNQSGGSTEYSGAVMIVNGSTTAGGLIGTSSGNVIGCYSSGRTDQGSYEEWLKGSWTNPAEQHGYDVSGGTVGGLIGTITGGAISNSYTTCSVSGSATAGGFTGTASGGGITNSYSTGLVNVASSGTKHAFLGGGSATLTGNKYFSIINEVETSDAYWGTVVELLPPYSGYDPTANASQMEALDLDLAAYNSFVDADSNWKAAVPYDDDLRTYYSSKYNLKTVEQLSTAIPSGYTSWSQLYVSMQYGDWPAPELLTINQ